MPTIKYFMAGTTFDRANRTMFGGVGRLAGDAPTDDDDADGRAKVMNVPSRININVLEPGTYVVVGRTLSRYDGTWEIPYLDTARQFTVIGVDPSQLVNSAIQDWVYPVDME